MCPEATFEEVSIFWLSMHLVFSIPAVVWPDRRTFEEPARCRKSVHIDGFVRGRSEITLRDEES